MLERESFQLSSAIPPAPAWVVDGRWNDIGGFEVDSRSSTRGSGGAPSGPAASRGSAEPARAAKSSPEPPGALRGGAGAELKRCQGRTLTMLAHGTALEAGGDNHIGHDARRANVEVVVHARGRLHTLRIDLALCTDGDVRRSGRSYGSG